MEMETLSGDVELFNPLLADESSEISASYHAVRRRYCTEPCMASSDGISVRLRHSFADTGFARATPTKYELENIWTQKRATRADTYLHRTETQKSRKRLQQVDPVAKEKRLREQRRQCQMRYRQRKHAFGVRLEKDVELLRQETNRLEEQYRAAVATASSESERTVWAAALEYFHRFRHGGQTAPQSPLSKLTFPSAGLDAVKAIVSPSLEFNSERGVQSMERHWRKCSLWFGDITLKPIRLKEGSKRDLEAATLTSFVVTEWTLRHVFPHLSAQDKRHDSNLARKLLGQRLTMRGWVRFEWDASACLVARIVSESDLLTPILRLLGNPEDVSRVFEQALISPEFQWKSGE